MGYHITTRHDKCINAIPQTADLTDNKGQPKKITISVITSLTFFCVYYPAFTIDALFFPDIFTRPLRLYENKTASWPFH